MLLFKIDKMQPGPCPGCPCVLSMRCTCRPRSGTRQRPWQGQGTRAPLASPKGGDSASLATCVRLGKRHRNWLEHTEIVLSCPAGAEVAEQRHVAHAKEGRVASTDSMAAVGVMWRACVTCQQ